MDPQEMPPQQNMEPSQQVAFVQKWDCETERINGQGIPDSKDITVGEVFRLKCKGEPVSEWQKDIQFILPENEPYSLKLLEVESADPVHLQLLVTSYKAKKFTLDGLYIKDGEQTVKIEPLPLSLESVVEVQPGEPPVLFGPVAPFKMPWPAWIYVVLALLIVGFASFIIVRIKRSLQRKRTIREIGKYMTPLSPVNQFNKDLRLMMRNYTFKSPETWQEEKISGFIGELEKYFRLFLLREFQVPADKWTSAVMVNHLSKKTKLKKAAIVAIKQVLIEFDRAVSQVKKLKMNDCQQLLEMCRNAANKAVSRSSL